MSVYSKNEAAGWNNGASGYSKAAEAGFYDNPGKHSFGYPGSTSGSTF